jgi:integrase/recombinase XerC
MQYSEAAAGFVRYLRFEKRYSAHTVEAYERNLLQFHSYYTLAYGEALTVKEISHHHIRSWLADIKEKEPDVKATTLNHKIATLSSFFRYAVRQGYVEKNPVRQLHAMRLPKRLPVALQEQQTDNLINESAFGPGFKGFTDRLICELLYSTGMRRQELLSLRETDIAWSQRLIRVMGKGGKERMIPVGASLIDDLRDYIAAKRKELERPDKEFLLVLETGKPMYASYVYRVVNTHLSNVTTQQKRSPHVLRHSFATHLLNNGANIQAIKELLGHASLAATQVYTSTDIERLKEIHKTAHPRG